MENRKRGNPRGQTNEHVAANLHHDRRSAGFDLRTLSERISGTGRTISPSALSKIENGDRRVDVDDLTAFAFSLGTTPAALLAPPAGALTVTGVPDLYIAEEIQGWIEGKVKLTVEDLLRYWTGEAHECRAYIRHLAGLVTQYGDGDVGVTPREVYEERLGRELDRIELIRGRLLQLDPVGAPIDD
jgi:transcriptional regulator with XRE-family HTH domain